MEEERVEDRFGIRAEFLILELEDFRHIPKFDGYKFENLEGKRVRYYTVKYRSRFTVDKSILV